MHEMRLTYHLFGRKLNTYDRIPNLTLTLAVLEASYWLFNLVGPSGHRPFGRVGPYAFWKNAFQGKFLSTRI